jgi:hypothetical protein
MKNLCWIALFICSSFLVNAQDSLSLNSGVNSQTNIHEIGSSEVKNKVTTDLYTQGQNDAVIHYKGYKLAANAVLISSILPGYGFLFRATPMIASDSNFPIEKNLGYPDPNLMKNEQYASGYKQKARQIKSEKLRRNYKTGLIIQISYMVIICIAGIIMTVK